MKINILRILLSTKIKQEPLFLLSATFFNLTTRFRHLKVQSLGEVLYVTAVSILESGKTPKQLLLCLGSMNSELGVIPGDVTFVTH